MSPDDPKKNAGVFLAIFEDWNDKMLDDVMHGLAYPDPTRAIVITPGTVHVGVAMNAPDFDQQQMAKNLRAIAATINKMCRRIEKGETIAFQSSVVR